MLTAMALAVTADLYVRAQSTTGGRTGAAATAGTNADARVTGLKTEAAAGVEELHEYTQQMVDSVFSFGELGFQEIETSKYLTNILREQGFTIEEGIAGIPTAWMASFGSGKPVIALGSDIDGIPQGSQKPGVAYHSPLIEGAPGHGEGHNSGMPLNVTAAIVLKKIMQREKIQGTIKLWPGVAEELLATKAYYVRDGYFKDVDIVLFAHVGSNFGVSWGDSTGNGLVSVEYTFRGESAHSANAPWRGRSALDAAMLTDIGWNYRREHLRIQQRSHSVITNGGDQPNVVPPVASIWYFFRETDYPNIKRMWEIGDNMAKAAALMTDTTMTSRVLGSAWPQHMNKTVAETMYDNIEKVGLPKWTDADQALAKALQKELGVEERGLPTELQKLSGRVVVPDDEKRGGGSDDIGDISWNVPTVTLRYPANIRSRARPQLGGRHRDGDAHRAQRRHRRRQGSGDDGARFSAQARIRDPGVGLLSQRADQGPQIHAADQTRGQARHLAEPGDDGEVPRADEEVLLRPEQVFDVPGAAWDQLSHRENEVGDGQRRRGPMKPVCRLMVCIAAIIGSPVLMVAETHRFTPTVYYPTYSFAHPPALRIKPGDRVITKTIDAGGNDENGKQVASIGANPEIGPFYVEGAEPGDMLVVTFEKIETNRKTAFSGSALAPYAGDPQALLQRQPGPAPRVNWTIDKEKGVARLENPDLLPAVYGAAAPSDARLRGRGACAQGSDPLDDTGTVGRQHGLQRAQLRRESHAAGQRARRSPVHGRRSRASR